MTEEKTKLPIKKMYPEYITTLKCTFVSTSITIKRLVWKYDANHCFIESACIYYEVLVCYNRHTTNINLFFVSSISKEYNVLFESNHLDLYIYT